jgi:pimeloyl-ACP methyl ester carboxylesterase
MLTSTTLAGAGVTLAGWTAGNTAQPPLLLVHGVSRRRATFSPLLPWLMPRFCVRAYDHRGHGGSTRADRYLVGDYAADAVRVVETVGKTVLYGHSLGALVALLVAAARPDSVAGIVLEDPPGPTFLAAIDRSAYAAVFTLYRDHAGSPLPVGELARKLAAAPLPGGPGMPETTFGATRDPANVRFTASCLKHLDPATMAPLLENAWLDGIEWETRIRRVTCPVLLLRADPARGGMLPEGDFRSLCETLADATPIDLPGVGHNAVGQQPEIVPRYVLPFLESLLLGESGRRA